MQSVQRSFGKLWSKGPGDNAKVSVLLNDYEDADKILAQIVENGNAWRNSWDSLVNSQLQIVTEIEGLYDPIVGATDGHGRDAVPTPQLQLERTLALKEVFHELRTDLLQEITSIEERVLRPATDARNFIAPIRKTIKKRENKRIDYEKLQEKAIKLQRKGGRSAKEEVTLAKTQDEVARTAEEFGIADDHLRQTLPPLIEATFALVPPLIANLVLIQNRLLGLYYTALNTYCEEWDFPSPPPPMDEVISTWDAAFGPIKSQIETISFVRARSMAQPAPVNGYRRTPSGLIPSPANAPQPRNLRVPSSSSNRAPSPEAPPTRPKPEWANPTEFTTATILGGGSVDRSRDRSPNSTHTSSSYFSRSPNASQSHLGGVSPSASTSTVNGIVKKKPPPPPPAKKFIPKPKPETWVVALYTFTGQGAGDLSFKEGDRIRVVTKTDTDQDWWTGELNGRQGSFPANYCKPL
ncbi:hypothetical protein QBC38DRAFT_460283 [Podospora fimiseda]|uniref:SH3 domain-containing protein n=1 Tax=Podospora fimiseda TaxID=252190 RepID=A0AAN6YRG2_9PEZI|nr:hypothetical protein QBC38DRAFT_460283 [Podospora fimiseda]